MHSLQVSRSFVFLGLDCDAMKISSRIGGPDSCIVRPNSKPWMVRLAAKDKPHTWDTMGHGCGGTLTSKHHVLTAEHCVFQSETDLILKNTIVVVGDHIISKSEGEELFDIEDIDYYSENKNIHTKIGKLFLNIIKHKIKECGLFELYFYMHNFV